MQKRLVPSLTLSIGILLLILVGTGLIQTVEAKTTIAEPKIGLIDLGRIKKEVPHFIALEKQAEANRRLLEEFIAEALAEHQQQIRDLRPEDYGRSRELALATQARIDQKRRELEESYQQKERAVLEELEAVVAKVAKDKKLDCILLKGGFQIGGEDVTDKIIKTWDKWGLTFGQRVLIFFGGADPRPDPLAEFSTGEEQK